MDHKKSDAKKLLVRNTTRSVPKTLITCKETERDKVGLKRAPPKKPQSTSYEPKFSAPQLNSSSKIAEKVAMIEKAQPRQVKSTTDMMTSEKMTRKMNFPQDRHIYKDLIPLQVVSKSQPALISRHPLPLKDKEPVLADFITVRSGKEYIYQPPITCDNKLEIVPCLNNLRLYKKLQANGGH